MTASMEFEVKRENEGRKKVRGTKYEGRSTKGRKKTADMKFKLTQFFLID